MGSPHPAGGSAGDQPERPPDLEPLVELCARLDDAAEQIEHPSVREIDGQKSQESRARDAGEVSRDVLEEHVPLPAERSLKGEHSPVGASSRQAVEMSYEAFPDGAPLPKHKSGSDNKRW